MSSTYYSKRRLNLETDLEIVWTQTRLTVHSVYFGYVSVLTCWDVNTWLELDKSLELAYSVMNPDVDCVLLCGDYNRKNIE